MKIRFLNRKCEGCGSFYDPTASHCPNCKRSNPEFSRKLYPVNESASLLKEVLFFAIGFIGLQLIVLIVAAITEKFYPVDSVSYYGIVQNASYGILFLILSLIAFDYWKTIGKCFLNKRTYFGFAVGIILVGFNVGYSAILAHYGISSNANQESLEKVVSFSKPLAFMFLGLAGPICEEITYRLGLFDLLKRAHIAIAYVVCAIFFGFIHFNFSNPDLAEWLNIPNYVICGAILCFANDRFGIGASMIAHIMNNIFALILMVI